MKRLGETEAMKVVRDLIGDKVIKPLLSDDDIEEIKEYAELDGLSTESIVSNINDCRSYLNDIRTCKTCKNAATCQASIRGYVPVIDSNAHIIYRPCKRYEAYRKNQQIANMLGSANIPLVYQTMSFESFDVNRIKGGEWLVKRAKSVITTGERETGDIFYRATRNWQNTSSGFNA